MQKWLVSSLACVFLWGLFFRSETVSDAVRQAICLCTDVLVPALFPFLAVSLFLSLCGAGEVFSLLLTPLTRFGLRLPSVFGQTVLFSLIGGYPVGARLLSSLVGEGRLSREDAATLLGFCVSPGPAFVVLAVGKRMLGSASLGALLLAAQLLAALLSGAILCRKRPVRLRGGKQAPMPLTGALVQAVSQASSGMLTICAYVVLCAAAVSLLPQKPAALRLLSAAAEVTTGCQSAAGLGGTPGALLAAFLLSFGGVSVCCQVAAIASEGGIPLRGFLRRRLFCGALSALFLWALLRCFPKAVPAMQSAAEPVVFSTPNRLLGGVCLCAMIFLTLSNVSSRRTVDF